MQTENTKNEIDRIDDGRMKDGLQIAGVGHGAGSISPVPHIEQNTTMEPMAQPQEDQKIPGGQTGKPHEELTKAIDRTGMLPEGLTKAIDRTGTVPEVSGKDLVPGRSKRPLVAIREAKRRAAIWGFAVADVVSEDDLPYDFIAMKNGITSFVRVRRIHDSWFDSKRIQERCGNEIAGFRAMKQQTGLIFELWIRGYARAFHRYRILQDAIEKIGIVLEPETRAGQKALENERSAVSLIPQQDNQETMAGEMITAISDPASP